MGDSRQVRREAVRQARRLVAGRVAFVGDVGEAAARRQAARAGMDEARKQAQVLIERARQDGAALLAEARDVTTAADKAYAEAFGAAVGAGWSVSLLVELGFEAPPRPGRAVSARTSAVHAGDGDRAGLDPIPGR